MNTDVRRNIFCVLMTSEDYLDAFEKLLRFVSSHISVSFFSFWSSLAHLKGKHGFLSNGLNYLFIFNLLCLKDGSEGQAGERDCSCSDGLLSPREELQRLLHHTGREILLT